MNKAADPQHNAIYLLPLAVSLGWGLPVLFAACATVGGASNQPAGNPEEPAQPATGESRGGTPAAPDAYVEKQVLPDIVSLVNGVRARGRKCGTKHFAAAKPVVWNDKLAIAALDHSIDMAVNNHFDHTGTNGLQVDARAALAGYDWSTIAENISKNSESMEHAVKGWTNSAGHCENMMNPNVTEVGAARANSFWTLVLARP